METFGKFMTIILLGVFITIIRAFVFCKLWIWFIIPTFQMQSLRIIEAIGILFLIGFVIVNNSKDDEKDWDDIVYWVFKSIFFVVFVLFAGYIASKFM